MTTAQAAESQNPYLEGFLAPVSTEVTATDLPVTGRIPEHLDGRYLRNGPNPVAEVDPATYHWFTGDAMVHGVALRDGKARWYRNRWVRTPAVCAALGEPISARPHPRTGIIEGGPNTNVLTHAGRTLALVEAGVVNYELTDELDTVGPCDFDGTLHGGYTAHPQRDPHTGELHAVSYSFARGHRVQYSVIGTDGHARRTVDIEVAGSPMMHSFSLTDNYVVIYDLPVTFDPMQVVPASVPRWLQRPARLVIQSVLGRVRIPDPIAALGFLVGAGAALSTPLYKQDCVTGSSTVASLDPDLLIGEMVFVPNPSARAEDDGILMGYGWHRGRDEGQLLLLDAQTLESIATVHLPQRVPMGFHGNWAPTT